MRDLPEAKISSRIVCRSRLLRSVKHQLFQTEYRANTLRRRRTFYRTGDDSRNPTKHDETDTTDGHAAGS